MQPKHKYVVWYKPVWYAEFKHYGETWAVSRAKAINNVIYKNKDYDKHYQYKAEMVV